MSQVPVKWVLEKDLFVSKERVSDYEERDNIACPVVPLSALREVVEGLKMIATGKWNDETTIALGEAILGGLEQHGRVSANEWLAQRLLASLGEVEK